MLWRARGGGAAIEFAISGLALFIFMLVIVNLGLLGFSLAAVARGVQSAARNAAVQAGASYVQNNSFTCPTSAQIAVYFNNAVSPPLPAAGTNAVSSNPLVTALWTNNAAGTGANEPPGVYLTLTATYNWRPVGLNFGSPIALKIATVATVLGSSASGVTIGASC